MRYIIAFLLLLTALHADITLFGKLHPGDNESDDYDPPDPLNLGFTHSYGTYLRYPSKFYLDRVVELQGVELSDLSGLDGYIRVWIDGEKVAQGDVGAARVDFSKYLTPGFHTIAITSSCYSDGQEVSCESSDVDDIDDFYFTSLKLITDATSDAVNVVQRIHIGDDTDDDDNYDLFSYRPNLYPDESYARGVRYLVNIDQELYGFQIFLSRVREIEDGAANKIYVYDSDDNLIYQNSLNESGFYDIFFDSDDSINGIKSIVISSARLSRNDRDDFSWDDLILLPFKQPSYYYIRPFLEYRFDECRWNSSLQDVVDSAGEHTGSVTSDEVKSVEGKLCRGAEIPRNSDDTSVAIDTGVNISEDIGNFGTISFWYKPNSGDGEGFLFDASDALSDDVNENKAFYLYRKDDRLYIFMEDADDNNLRAYSDPIGFQSDEWVHITVYWNALRNLILFYKNGELVATNYQEQAITTKLQTKVSLYIGDNRSSYHPDVATGNSADGVIDEFKIFQTKLTPGQIKYIYDFERSGKNYDDTPRVCESCQLHPVLEYRLDGCDGDVVVKDSSANGLDADVIADVGFSDAVVCRGADFNGESGYIQRADSDLLDNTQSLSIMFWFKARSVYNPEGGNYGARGILAKRVKSGDNDAYSAFFWNDHEMPDHEHARLYIDFDRSGAGDRFFTNSYFYINRWYFVTIVFDGRYPQQQRLKVYVNGELDSQFALDTTTLPNYASDLFVGNLKHGSVDKLFDGIVDEVKIAREPLHPQLIKEIYERELAGKNWWDGSGRLCSLCPSKSVKFDLWDTFRDRDDRNVSTKIVGEVFELTLAEVDEEGNYKDDFNGTVCVTLFDAQSKERISDWNATFWEKGDEENVTRVAFFVDRALNNAKAYIYWKRDLYEDNSSCDEIFNHPNNETNATDNFAIRPKAFWIDVSGKLYAGEELKIDFLALDANEQKSRGYNEQNGTSFTITESVKTGCVKGAVDYNETPLVFDEGNLSRSLRYAEVGLLRIDINESQECSSRFSSVDCKDGNVSGIWSSDVNTTIEPATKSLFIAPYEINVTKAEFVNSFGTQWLYMSQNLDETNITIDITIGAFNKAGELTQDYNESCYQLENVRVDFGFDLNNTSKKSDDEIAVLYRNVFNANVESNAYLSDLNLSYDIATSSFYGGEASSKWAMGIDKNISAPLSPIEVELVRVAPSNSSALFNNVRKVSGKKSLFYYGRLKTADLATSKTTDSTTVEVLVFDRIGYYTKDCNQTILNWYLWDRHSDRKFGSIKKAAAYKDTAMSQPADMQVTINDPVDGRFVLDVTKQNDTSGYIHLDISPWLWFSYEDGANYDPAKDCLHHPCIKYDFFVNSSVQVQSGEITGVNFEQNVTKQRRGVKVFR